MKYISKYISGLDAEIESVLWVICIFLESIKNMLRCFVRKLDQILRTNIKPN